MDDYEKYEKNVQKNIKRNERFLKEFKNEMNKQNLSPKTINKHLNNIKFYLNTYLNYFDVIKMEDGAQEIDLFLGDWFIHKCLWASITSIKENATSIKKFYKCMYELNHINKDTYDDLCLSIKENMEDWLEELTAFDNMDFDGFF